MKSLTKNILVAIVSITLILVSSCKKNDNDGKAEIHALIYHNATPIMASTLYVKFGTQSQPSNPETNYDLKLQGEDDDNHVHVEDMRPGEYYLYAVGYDSIANMEVRGGAATKIKWSERKKLKEVHVQVGE